VRNLLMVADEQPVTVRAVIGQSRCHCYLALPLQLLVAVALPFQLLLVALVLTPEHLPRLHLPAQSVTCCNVVVHPNVSDCHG
jgi:hypothetical protein